MKKLFTLFSITALCALTQAQVTTPPASVPAEYDVQVGLTEVELTYNRPNMNGRQIFGGLVPYGQVWRTGANKNSTIQFSDDVKIGNYTLKAGKYAIYTIPSPQTWEVIFYIDNENWGLPSEWDETKVAAKVTAKVHKLPITIETFSISIDDIRNDTAKLNFLWSDIYVEVPIEFPTDQKVMTSIQNTLQNNPKYSDYLAAANYYYTTRKDINQAKEWIDKGMKINQDPKFWQLRQQALIYAEAGDFKGAIQLAQQSTELAKKAGNNDYIRMNEEAIKEWNKKK